MTSGGGSPYKYQSMGGYKRDIDFNFEDDDDEMAGGYFLNEFSSFSQAKNSVMPSSTPHSHDNLR